MAKELEEYKELSCRDFRSDCDFTIRPETQKKNYWVNARSMPAVPMASA